MYKIRVVMADDHPGLLATARRLLEAEVDVVGCVEDGEGLVEAAIRLRPDIIVADISMPRLSGICAVIQLRKLGCSSKVVFLSIHDDPDIIQAALAAGAHAYVQKISLTTDLLFAIREAYQGRIFVSLT
jgi:DNA-binding NarL/FixJ family response regulator